MTKEEEQHLWDTSWSYRLYIQTMNRMRYPLPEGYCYSPGTQLYLCTKNNVTGEYIPLKY